MASSAHTSYEEALEVPFEKVVRIARSVGCTLKHKDSRVAEFLDKQIYAGYLVELEHGTKWGVDSPANITNNDIGLTVRIAWSHILEDPLYYTRLANMEGVAEKFLDVLLSGKLHEDNALVKKVHLALEPSRKNRARTKEEKESQSPSTEPTPSLELFEQF